MDVSKIFGSKVFSDAVMKARLDDAVYLEFRKCVDENRSLELSTADAIAKAMMDWAIEQGCTHYTHWFQPMTGITAEKHDSFIIPDDENCSVINEFSGKELIKGEPDASSFPNGGLRATFEARGYTAWDPTSYAFIKDGVLCIPTAFCSYTGAALDKKTPLLRSMQALNNACLPLLALFGKKVKKVIPCAGPEQEYFLIDRALYKKRPDLVFTGRTLFGARSPKGQELDDHYFGAVKPRVAAYMRDLDEELWKVGVLAKTKHNEVAPAQHELAIIFRDCNTATDHNQIVMELMKRVATKHGFKCLLHEKPFAGINGSGKHNNWSIITDSGDNLFDSGDTPESNMLFLTMLCAVINAVDNHQDLLRISVASADNDHRLGEQEAPPTIISIYLGEELLSILEAIANGGNYLKHASSEIQIGVTVLPKLPKDSTDRNRTSPFAFTGNKFEFRMPGSRSSIAGINTILNTIVADELLSITEIIKNAPSVVDGVTKVIKYTYDNHRKIIFNGNGYSEDWIKEAQKRGLCNLPTTVDALPLFKTEDNINLFVRHKVYSKVEIESHTEILIESYCKKLHIEGITMLDMVRKCILPAVTSYLVELTDLARNLKKLDVDYSLSLIKEITSLYEKTLSQATILEEKLDEIGYRQDIKGALFYRDEIIPTMKKLRACVDDLELRTAKKYWPYPTYEDLLF